MELCHQTASPQNLAPHLIRLFINGVLGRGTEGIGILERIAEKSDSLKLMATHSRTVTWLGHSYLLAGRLPDAMRCAQSALENAEAHNQRGYKAEVMWLIGEMSATVNPAKATNAEDAYHASLALADELSMR